MQQKLTNNNNNRLHKILIVEDNPDCSNLLKIAFEQKGFAVLKSKDGLEGITKAAAEQPDIVLLDLMMPDMDGYAFLQALHKNTSLNPLVIVNSNMEQKKDEEKALQMGSHFYLKKSQYTPFEVADKVLELWEQQRPSKN